MAKKAKIVVNEDLNLKTKTFMENVSSVMSYKSELTSNSISTDWIDLFELCFPFMDNIIRVPKVTLIMEEEVVKTEKARKIGVASVKDLTKHTQFIEKIDPITDEVQPSKILIERYEETFNTYENRFIYTTVDNASRFISKKERILEDFKIENDKVLEFASNTNNGVEKINLELKITASELPNGKKDDDVLKEIEILKARIKRLKDYISSWQKSEMFKQLTKSHVPMVFPPIRKTNLILKNPNFQMTLKLWDFVQNYDHNDSEGTKEGLDTDGDDLLKGILEGGFLMDYFVFDSIRASKKEQKQRITDYAIIMLKQEIQRLVFLLLNSGIKLTDEEILEMISSEIKNEKEKRFASSTDVKNKFKSALDEYLERTQDYL